VYSPTGVSGSKLKTNSRDAMNVPKLTHAIVDYTNFNKVSVKVLDNKSGIFH
jgi:hypothetical protein